MCKQLNGPVLKSLKPSCLSRYRKKKIGLAGLGLKFQFPFRAGPKFQFSFRAGQGQNLNFNFSFGPDRARSEFFSLYFGPGRAEIVAMRARPDLKNPARADLQCILRSKSRGLKSFLKSIRIQLIQFLAIQIVNLLESFAVCCIICITMGAKLASKHSRLWTVLKCKVKSNVFIRHT